MSVKKARGKIEGKRPTCVATRVEAADPDSTSDSSLKLTTCQPEYPRSPPNIVETLGGEEGSEVLVIGVAARPAFARLVVILDGGDHVRIPVGGLRKDQRQETGISRGSFGGAAIDGSRCIKRILGYGAQGQLLYRGPPGRC